MKKKIAILGSTGSIGETLINIIKQNSKNFKIVLLTANKDYKKLIQQAKKFKVNNLILTDKLSYKIVKSKTEYKKLNIYQNFECLNKIFKEKKIDYVMNSIVGLSGLKPTLDIIKFTNQIAIANKESIICGWNLIQHELKKNNTDIIPVDSEHFSIWSLLNNYKIRDNSSVENEIKNIVITASGGPFLNTSLKKFSKIRVKDAINHPTWKMGKKISIDSATLVNKIFETIEAQRLFKIKIKDVIIKIHNKSYIHSIINFKNGLIKICAHKPDMTIPISNSLKNNNSNNFKDNIDFKILNNLEFKKVNKKKFKVITILRDYPNYCTLYDTAFVAINDVLVDLFLKNKISFIDISKILIKMLKSKKIQSLKKRIPKNFNEIYQINEFVRLQTLKQSIN